MEDSDEGGNVMKQPSTGDAAVSEPREARSPTERRIAGTCAPSTPPSGGYATLSGNLGEECAC